MVRATTAPAPLLLLLRPTGPTGRPLPLLLLLLLLLLFPLAT
ncbi:hypothetical protein ACQXVK_06665 [Curtobacterium sp. AB451]